MCENFVVLKNVIFIIKKCSNNKSDFCVSFFFNIILIKIQYTIVIQPTFSKLEIIN